MKSPVMVPPGRATSPPVQGCVNPIVQTRAATAPSVQQPSAEHAPSGVDRYRGNGPVPPAGTRRSASDGGERMTAACIPKPARSITQGEYATGSGEDGAISTVLGSCIAACLHDPVATLGGMNHFLLPNGSAQAVGAASYGVYAMELLINDLIKRGAAKPRLTAKVFGGARMVEGLSDVGARNADCVMDFLNREGIVCISHSLGGIHARRVEFWPGSGRARQRLLRESATMVDLPQAPRIEGNGVELF